MPVVTPVKSVRAAERAALSGGWMRGRSCSSAIVLTAGGLKLRPRPWRVSGLVITTAMLKPAVIKPRKLGALKSAVPKKASGVDLLGRERFEFAII